MKRTNVILDEKLLEEARRVMGEKTYSATITKALENAVRQKRFWEKWSQLEPRNPDDMDRDYIEHRWPEVAAVIWPRETKQRASAHERRAPAKKRRRVSR